jgi:hypothetical protein
MSDVYTEDPNNPGKDKKTGLTRLQYKDKFGAAAAGLTDPTGFTDGRTVVISPAGARTAVVGRPGSPQKINQTTPAASLGVSEAKNLFNGGLLSQDPATLSIADFMFKSGIISSDPRTAAGRAAASKAYNRAVDNTADANQFGNMVTVMDMLTLDYEPGSVTGSGSGTSTFKQFSTYTKDQARKKAVDAYRAVLGRSPSEQEIAEFSNGLINAAKAAPSIQKTKTGRKGTSQETTQGFNEKDWTLGYLSAKIPADQDLLGASGVAQDMVTGLSQAYGVKLSPALAYDSVRDIIEGKLDADGLEQVFKEQAKILFPHLSDKIDSGLNPRKIADSYIGNTVNILEKGPTEVDMFNPYVKEALTYKDKDGNYALPTADEHARMLRSKSEWLDTRNGKETLMSAADNILRQMGFE